MGMLFCLSAANATARDLPAVPPFVGETPAQTVARAALLKAIVGVGKPLSDQVLKAMAIVPRHLFMAPGNADKAYDNDNIAIGWGQTITRPSSVANMTEQLKLTATDRVLEVGTGSGYHSSVMSQITPNVFTIEIVKPLAERTHALLRRIGYDRNIHFTIGDGYEGWKENAPYDKIVVTCAADHIPLPLIQQLKPGGVMLIPVGAPFSQQKIYLIEKDAEGAVKKKVIGAGQYVPMLRKWGN